ncbi:unnamed protein product [Chrysodeixis includens]|uniref:Programmed cell death protein 2 C-terminal domain-containing protein n=1 Tax=Chrysodeixis includens TaxID=689277 RepID=A0A9P0BMS2_CHRIL|nr:unnamed protein product [Chrysodeixis includens]
MAKKQGKIYLGYEDEAISDKNHTLSNYTVNKIGGLPDWPPLDNLLFPSKCPLCGLHRVLVVQCYAPLDNSVYHRTLYVFACINPNCWIQSESWLCVRSQYQDKSANESSVIVAMPSAQANLAWCSGCDEWDENDNDTANGNLMNIDNAPSPNNAMHRNSDEDDESNSFELENVEQALGNLHVFDAHNANMSPIQGAVGAIGAPRAAAELEGGDEPGLVSVDTPTAPSNDVEALLHQTAELPHDLRSRLMCGPLQFVPKFIYVEEEWISPTANDDRANSLLSRYIKEDELEVGGGDRAGAGGAGGGSDEEPYEEATPLHGDKLFHAFLTRLRENPGQILRYSREQSPVLGAPLPSSASTPDSPSVPTICARCGARLLCELQLVPEFAESLRLLPSNAPLAHLHFLSVLIFTCSQSCWQASDTLVKEFVVFQPEVV